MLTYTCILIYDIYRCGAMFVEPPGDVLQGLNAKARDSLHHAQYQVLGLCACVCVCVRACVCVRV